MNLTLQLCLFFTVLQNIYNIFVRFHAKYDSNRMASQKVQY